MITREDLNRARDLVAEIVRKSNRLAVMYARVTGGAIDYHEKVQSSATNSQEGLMVYMSDLEQELDSDRKELRELQKEIRAWAETLPSAEKQVVMMRYIVSLSWSEIIDNMGYSPRQVFRFHGDAVRRLSNCTTKNDLSIRRRESCKEDHSDDK